MTDEMQALIKRLEEARRGSGHLDKEIEIAIGSRKAIFSDSDTAEEYFRTIPSYTTSLDAALTLVPEGWNRRISESDRCWWWAELREGFETSYGRVEIGQSPCAPLALCIAALKARQAKDSA